MDPILFKAAKDGDVQTLLRSLQDDPLILERVATTTADTPLHVAAMLGHLEFVQELIKRMSKVVDYVKELNQHGFSAMHLACSNGHVEVVRELLKVASMDHQDLCSLKGRDGLTPLHCASIKGRLEVIVQLLSGSASCVSEVNAAGETALHLAVKNYQLGALATLVDVIKQNNMLETLNSKDREGNTVFHVAAGRKNSKAIELLLKFTTETPGARAIAVNATNGKGLTALDLFLLCPCENGLDTKVERLFRQAGDEIARVSIGIESPPPPAQAHNGEILVLPTNYQSSPPKNTAAVLDMGEPWEDYFKFQYGKDKPNDVRNALLVVAVLMATTTYQAGFTPPGGVNDENGPIQGQSRLASYAPVSFIFFSIFNSAGFFISLNTIMVLTNNFPLFWELYVAIIAMVVTYDNALYQLTPPNYLRKINLVVATVMPITIVYVSIWIRFLYRQHRGGPAYRRV